MRTLAPDEWLAALVDPDHPITFPWFGFDTVSWDWAYHDRILDDHLFYLPTAGTCVGEIEGIPITVEAGSLLWMQPRVRHTFLAGEQPLTLYFTRFRLRADADDLRLAGPTAVRTDGAWDLVDLFDDLQDELRTQLPWRDLRVRGLLLAIAAAALRHLDSEWGASSQGMLSRAQRRAIENYVRDHVAERPSPRDLAAQVRLSPDYFSRLFARTFGMPARTWLVRERLRHGARLLSETVRTIAEVAKALGYDDVSTFSHQFKERYGMSPRTFRQTHH